MIEVLLRRGQGRRLVTSAQEVTFKATADMGSSVSIFEVVVPPGFDVGAHTHASSQEFFYLLEGELLLMAFEPIARTAMNWDAWESPSGQKPVRGGPGCSMFVPAGMPHAFKNDSEKVARMLFQSYPAPHHEVYFEELIRIFTADPNDKAAVDRLRERYEITQITPLSFSPPPSSLQT